MKETIKVLSREEFAKELYESFGITNQRVLDSCSEITIIRNKKILKFICNESAVAGKVDRTDKKSKRGHHKKDVKRGKR